MKAGGVLKAELGGHQDVKEENTMVVCWTTHSPPRPKARFPLLCLTLSWWFSFKAAGSGGKSLRQPPPQKMRILFFPGMNV